jgi:branched-chain amino acid transport system substrate-binding protein
VLYVGGYHTEAGLIKRQMVDQGLKTLLVSGDALVTTEYWQITGDAGEGTLMTFSPDPRKNPEAASVVKEFKDKGVEPEGYVLYSYAAVQAWAQAATTAGATDFQKVVDALDKGSFKTVLGTVSFNEKGDVKLPGYVVYEWSKGNYDYMKKM